MLPPSIPNSEQILHTLAPEQKKAMILALCIFCVSPFTLVYVWNLSSWSWRWWTVLAVSAMLSAYSEWETLIVCKAGIAPWSDIFKSLSRSFVRRDLCKGLRGHPCVSPWIAMISSDTLFSVNQNTYTYFALAFSTESKCLGTWLL